MAKALTSAYFPLSAITIEEELYQAMLEESRKLGMFGHGYTYTAHPVGCAVALKTIEIYRARQGDGACGEGVAMCSRAGCGSLPIIRWWARPAASG